jgi:hypothetical protein
MELDARTTDRIRDMVRLCGLDEGQLRAYLAVEASVAGPGSEGAVARAAGVAESLVRDGLRDLQQTPIPLADA